MTDRITILTYILAVLSGTCFVGAIVILSK